MSTFAERVRHAFAMPDESPPLSAQDAVLLDRLAEAVVRRGLAAPALLLLESATPLNFLGSQALHFLTPLIELAVPARDVEQAAGLLERRDSLRRLAELIEARSNPPSRAR